MSIFRLGAAATALLTLTVAAAPAADYEIDPVHSSLVFNVMHAGVAPVYGRFNDFGGTIAFDPDDLAASAVDVTVQATSIDTGNQKRDGHLRGGDFFDVGQFPTITFSAEGFEDVGDGSYQVDGELTLLGTTKPVAVTVTKSGAIEGHPKFGTRVGMVAELTIKRSDFGMTWGVENDVVGDEVELLIAFEGKQ